MKTVPTIFPRWKITEPTERKSRADNPQKLTSKSRYRFGKIFYKSTHVQQRQIGSLCGKSMKNFVLTVYHANSDSVLYINQDTYNNDKYSISNTSSSSDSGSFTLWMTVIGRLIQKAIIMQKQE